MNLLFGNLQAKVFIAIQTEGFSMKIIIFKRFWTISGIYGGWLVHSFMNGMFDFHFATFYPFRQFENANMNIMPLRNYSQYDKVSNTNTYIPAPVYFVISGLNNSNQQNVNAEEEINHKLKPVNISESKLNYVTAIEVRKVSPYSYEKTKYDNVIERNIEWRKYSNNSNNTNSTKTYTSGSTTTGTSTTTTGNNGSKGGNNGNKTTESAKKRSE